MKQLFSLSKVQAYVVAILFLFSSCVATKDASNLEDNYTAYKQVIEYEAQRYLIEEVLKVSNEEKVKMKIIEISRNIDTYSGNMFRMIAYSFEGKKGIVATAFNVLKFDKDRNIQFVSTNITPQEVEQINTFYSSIDAKSMDKNDFHIYNLNDEIVINIYKSYSNKKVELWLSELNKAEMSYRNWEQIYKEFKELN